MLCVRKLILTATQPMLSLIFLCQEQDGDIYSNKEVVATEIQMSSEQLLLCQWRYFVK